MDIKSESNDSLKDRTRSKAKKNITNSNKIQISTIAEEKIQTPCPSSSSDILVDEDKVKRSRKVSKKTQSTVPIEVASPSVGDQEVIISQESSNILDQEHIVDSNVNTQFKTILSAIKENKVVELFFIDAENNPPRTFEPRQLIFDAFAKDWYVWGWDRRYNTERHHLLALIDKINIINGIGRSTQGPYKDGTPANFIGGLLGGEAIHVKLIIFKQWIFAVRQAPIPFPDFKIEELEEGKAQITFTATDLRSIARWVMQFGDGIQVIEPQRLIDRIKQVSLAWSGKAAVLPYTSKPTQIRQDQHSEHKLDHRCDTKPEIAQDHRNSEHPKKNKENADAAKTKKVEIRTGRL